MAAGSVIRSDIVQIRYDVDDSPLRDINDSINDIRQNTARVSSGGIDDLTDELNDVRNEADDATSAVRNLDRRTDELSSNGADDLSRDLDSAASDARQAANEIRDTANETRELSDEANGASKSFESIEKMASGLKGALAGVAGALGVSAVVGNINEMQNSLNKFQSQTGASTADMSAYADSIKNLYGNAMGESIEDVSNSMAAVMQVTELSGKELENTTNSALLMRDTFDFEVNESVRAVDMMMRQFGVDADTAYSMIAQGAQNGLNKNDDLLDTVNEYSVHFKQLGFNSEDMFNMLANGAKSGTFSVDKLGDAVKEFGVRAIDGSDSTAEGFKTIGLSADDMARKFKSGGDVGKAAFQETIDALRNMEDPIARDAAGVQLFGTMWEDLGAEGIFALSNIEGGITETKDALNQINEVRYDDLGSALEAIKRKGSMAISTALTPLANKAINLINKFDAWKEKIGLIDKIKDAFVRVKTAVQPVTDAVKDVIIKVKEVATSSTTIDAVKNAFDKIKGVVTPVIGIIAAVITEIKNIATSEPVVNGIKLAFEGIKTVFDGVLTAATAVFGFIRDNINWILPLVEGLVIAFGAYKAIMLAVKVAQIAYNAVMAVTNAIMMANPVGLIIAAIGLLIGVIILCVKHWDEIKAKALEVWASIVAIWGVVSAWFKANVIDPIVNFFTGLWTTITGIFSVVGTYFSNKFTEAYNGIKNAFSNVVSFFSGIWEKIKSMFTKIGTTIGNGIADAFKTVVNSVINFAENTINGFIRAINGAIELINKIPGVSISTISELSVPRLAKGGIVDRPTIAEIGENGKEAIVPLENNTGWINKVISGIADVFKMPATSSGGTTNSSIINNTGGKTENNYFNPSFTLNMNGAAATDDNKRKVKQWIKEALNETFDMLDKNNKPVIEV